MELCIIANQLGITEMVLATDKFKDIEKDLVFKYQVSSFPLGFKPLNFTSFKYAGITVHLFDKNQTKEESPNQ